MPRTILSLLLPLLLVGCAISEPPRRSVEELFREALEAARLHDDPAQRLADEVAPAAEGPARVSRSRPEPLAKDEAELGPPVSDVFIETDVREAIRALALQAGVQVVIDDQVRGSANATLEQVPFERALETLLLPLGYVFGMRNGIYLVGSPAPSSALFPHLAETWRYRPRHLTPAELLEILPTDAIPYVKASARRNVMVVRAPEQMGRAILAELEALDQPVPQVVMEAIICVHNPDSRLEFGLDVQQGFRAADDVFANIGITDLAAGAALGPAGAPTLAGLSSFKFTQAFLKALDAEGYVGIRAAPRVMARDGERAVITIGRETFFTVGDGNTIIRDLEPVQSGIILDIVPRVRGNTVTLAIERAEVSDEVRPSRIVSDESDDRLPTISTRRVTTTVEVQDGETIVIGGLVQRREVNRVVKVPLLGDIPLLGILFQRIDRQEEEAEVAIFIAPRIVR